MGPSSLGRLAPREHVGDGLQLGIAQLLGGPGRRPPGPPPPTRRPGASGPRGSVGELPAGPSLATQRSLLMSEITGPTGCGPGLEPDRDPSGAGESITPRPNSTRVPTDPVAETLAFLRRVVEPGQIVELRASVSLAEGNRNSGSCPATSISITSPRWPSGPISSRGPVRATVGPGGSTSRSTRSTRIYTAGCPTGIGSSARPRARRGHHPPLPPHGQRGPGPSKGLFCHRGREGRR